MKPSEDRLEQVANFQQENGRHPPSGKEVTPAARVRKILFFFIYAF